MGTPGIAFPISWAKRSLPLLRRKGFTPWQYRQAHSGYTFAHSEQEIAAVALFFSNRPPHTQVEIFRQLLQLIDWE